MQENINQPQIGGNIKFSPYSGLDLSAGVSDLSKLPPAMVIVLGFSVVALGFYLLSKEKKEKEKN